MQKNISFYRAFLCVCGMVLLAVICVNADVTEDSRVMVTAFVSGKSIPLNHVLRYTVKVEWTGDSSKYTFTFPEVPELHRFEVIGSSSSNRKYIKGEQPHTEKEFTYLLKPLEKGTGLIDASTLEYEYTGQGTRDILRTQPIELEITSPEIPFFEQIMPFLVPAAAGIAGLILIFILVRLSRKRRRSGTRPQITESEPLEDLCKNRLQDLSRLIPMGESHQFYSAIYDILKDYFHDRWELIIPAGDADRQTFFRELDIPEPLQTGLYEMVRTCDLVKFAGTRPTSREMTDAQQCAIHFLDAVKGKDTITVKGARNSL